MDHSRDMTQVSLQTTRRNPLDFIIISKNLRQYLVSLEIDKNLHWTPSRPIGKAGLRFSDHYALICKFRNIPRKNQRKAKRILPTIWNLRKRGGWERYRANTDNAEAIEKIIKSSNNMSINFPMVLKHS